MRRLAVLASVVAVAAIAASPAHTAIFFLFEPTAADAGGVATVRLGGTPAGFTLADRKKPFRDAIRLYLVPADVAGEVRSRFDPRLHFVGRIVPDRRSRGILSFRVPPLDSGSYAIAYWCPGCAPYSRGVKFGVQTVPRVSRYRRSMSLDVRLPSAAESCPVSGDGRYGTDLLSTTLPPNGVLGTRVDDDGLFQKLGWLPRGEPSAPLTVRGERLDAPSPPMKVLGVFWGHSYVGGVRGRGSWASAVNFPSEGCWRITGRFEDVTLSYVVKVVRGF
jgi:hypothetical protein